MYKSYRQAALDNIDQAMYDSLIYCSQLCEEEGLKYTMTDLIALAKLILEEEQRDRERARS